MKHPSDTIKTLLQLGKKSGSKMGPMVKHTFNTAGVGGNYVFLSTVLQMFSFPHLRLFGSTIMKRMYRGFLSRDSRRVGVFLQGSFFGGSAALFFNSVNSHSPNY